MYHIFGNRIYDKDIVQIKRFGNKSVISNIVPDDQMPYTKDGRRVHLVLSVLSIINRTIGMALFEPFINNCTWKVIQKMKECATFEEQVNLIFRYMACFSIDEYNHVLRKFNKKSDKGKHKFIQKIIDEGRLPINISSLWEDQALFYKCINAIRDFDILFEDTVYINKWGREIKLLNDFILGEMYILKLKQSDRRGFSARSTGAVSMKGLPIRSFKSKAHLEQHSSSCIRFRKLNPYIVIYR